MQIHSPTLIHKQKSFAGLKKKQSSPKMANNKQEQRLGDSFITTSQCWKKGKKEMEGDKLQALA